MLIFIYHFRREWIYPFRCCGTHWNPPTTYGGPYSPLGSDSGERVPPALTAPLGKGGFAYPTMFVALYKNNKKFD